jgi:phosphatidylserine/phosphatidylglycerophosphate/cardiolipin synthase-like enzyme
VQVQVILDKSQRTEKYSSADFLANQGVPTMIDADHAISHHKVMTIDGEIVMTGSFNFTKAAEKNAENVRRISGGEERNLVAKIAEIACTHPTHPRR